VLRGLYEDGECAQVGSFGAEDSSPTRPLLTLRLGIRVKCPVGADPSRIVGVEEGLRCIGRP
jgi:hypothetical protein